MEMIDLSRLIYDGMPKIPVLPEVHVQKCLSLEKGHPLNVTELSLACHAGTHVDAPIHIVPTGKSIEELPLDAFVGPGAVIAVKKQGGEEVKATGDGFFLAFADADQALEAAVAIQRALTAARVSRSTSRRLIVSRLSCACLPFASARSTLTFPALK